MRSIKITPRRAIAAAAAVFSIVCGAAAADTVSPPPAWKISSKTSALDGTTRYSAMLDAVSKVANAIGRPEAPTLVVRCVPRSGLASFIAWPLYMGSSDVQVVYRFDQEPVQHGVWSISEDGRASGFFETSRGLKGFLDKLSSAKRLVVQAPTYQSLPVEAEFELGAAAEVVAAAAKACA